MEEHLTEEEFKLINNRDMRGKGLLKALKHIEVCEQCRSKVKRPSKEEILKRFDIEFPPKKAS